MKKETPLISIRNPQLKARLDELVARLKALGYDETITSIVTPPIEREVKRREKEIEKKEKIIPLVKVPAGHTIESIDILNYNGTVKGTFKDEQGNLCEPKIFKDGEEVNKKEKR